MPIDVRQDHLAIVQNILKQHVPTLQVVLFGSRFNHTAHDTSDLDLCIISGKRLTFETLANLRDAFSDSNLPYKVDVLDWATVEPEFRKHILDNCVEIQAAG